MGTVSTSWHRYKHASWLTDFVWPGDNSLMGWQGGDTQPGQETRLLTLAPSSVAHGTLDNLTFSNLKPKEIKTEPRDKSSSFGHP